MTREEAEAKVQEELTTTNWFCPLIQASCNIKCLCYIKPRIIKDKVAFENGEYTFVYYTCNGYCNNYSLVGPS
jgi:hypothetical protein